MGILQDFIESLKTDRHQVYAHNEVRMAREDIEAIHGTNREIVRPLVAERLKFSIQGTVKQGGLEVYRDALAVWQISKACYPEWITDEDRPVFVEKSWDLV